MIHHTVTVSVPPERAFSAFVEELNAWWPPEYTWSADALEEIAIEPREGGRCFERHGADADGYRAALDSEQGWPYILGRYAAHVGG